MRLCPKILLASKGVFNAYILADPENKFIVAGTSIVLFSTYHSMWLIVNGQ